MRNDTKTVRFTFEEIQAMNQRGDYVPTRPDAVEAVVDETFWANSRAVVRGDAPPTLVSKSKRPQD